MNLSARAISFLIGFMMMVLAGALMSRAHHIVKYLGATIGSLGMALAAYALTQSQVWSTLIVAAYLVYVGVIIIAGVGKKHKFSLIGGWVILGIGAVNLIGALAQTGLGNALSPENKERLSIAASILGKVVENTMSWMN